MYPTPFYYPTYLLLLPPLPSYAPSLLLSTYQCFNPRCLLVIPPLPSYAPSLLLSTYQCFNLSTPRCLLVIPPGTVGVNNPSAIFVVQMDASASVCPVPLTACPVMTGLSTQKGVFGQGLGLRQGSGPGIGEGQGSGLEWVHSEAHVLHFITEVGGQHPPPPPSTSPLNSPYQLPLMDTL